MALSKSLVLASPRSRLFGGVLAHALIPLVLVVGTLPACGDDVGSGKVEETVLDIEDVIDVITDIITFETAETQVATETAIETSVPDGTTPDGTTPNDVSETQEGCRTFGCACNGNNECLDELCIESADGNVCTRTCVADCPANFDCLSSTTFGDPISVCVPRHTRLCRPCRADAECDDPGDPYPAYCLADPADNPPGASGSFCGSSCANRDCPEGYACQDATLSGGGTAKQCVPVSGECTCRPAWGELGYSTDCAVTNTFGSCDGSRSCTPNGLSPCLGPQATPEVCDNQDNNCDGQTDNLTATACFVQNANGQCPGTLGCEAGAPKCLGPEPQAETCNGLDDNCNVAIDENTCNDNLACTTDLCASPNQCQNALVNGNCLINGACFQTGGFNPQNPCEVCDPAKSTASFSQSANTCVINNQCFPANTTNPTNACQICIPGQSATSWSTSNNTCQIGGQCYAANQANPQNQCELCRPISSTTTWTQPLDTCNIQGQCFAAGVKNPGQECLVCDPTKNTTGWSNAGNTVSCEDNNACSAVSTCDGAGSCVGDVACNDHNPCTTDTCDPRSGCDNSGISANYCRIQGTCSLSGAENGACQFCDPARSQTSWSPRSQGVGCNADNNACTPDTCNGQGACTAGAVKSCADDNVCTADSCNPSTGACVFSGLSGTACSDNNACTSDSCSNGTCIGTPNLDPSEPNNAIDSARSVSVAAICDNGQVDTPAGSFSATIYGQGDVDWYKYKINDDCSNWEQPSPWVRLANVPPSSNFRLCAYYACDDWGDGDEGACENNGGSPSTFSFGGRNLKGCCSDGAGSSGEFVWYYPACNNRTWPVADQDTGTTYFRVDQVGGDLSCGSYSITFGDE